MSIRGLLSCLLTILEGLQDLGRPYSFKIWDGSLSMSFLVNASLPFHIASDIHL